MRHWIDIVAGLNSALPSSLHETALRSGDDRQALAVLTQVSEGRYGRGAAKRLFRMFAEVAQAWSTGRKASRFFNEVEVYDFAKAALPDRSQEAEVLGRAIGDLLDRVFATYAVEKDPMKRDLLAWSDVQDYLNQHLGARLALHADRFDPTD